jgi:exopolysaccharide production protein ExoQ
MMQLIGTIACIAGVAWLFYLDRDPESRSSPALWIPTFWLLICGSRSVTEWLAMRPAVSLAKQYSESSPIDAAFYAILIASAFTVLNFRYGRVKSFLRQNLPLLLFFAYCAISVLWSDYPFVALKRWCKSVGDLVMIMIVLTDLQPKQAFRQLFKRAAFLLLPLSVLLIGCYPDLGTGYNPEDRTVMYFGVTTFKNMLGLIAMVCGLFSLWQAVCAYEDRAMRNRRGHMLAHSIVFIIAGWLIVQANSMTSLACLVLAGTVMILVGQRSASRWYAGVPLIAAAALIVPAIALFVDPLGPLLHSLGRNSTFTGRTLIWQAVLSLHTDPWFGTGFESFWLGNRLERVWHMSVDRIQEAHNGYLELYLNLGWCGILLLGAFVVSGYARGIAAVRHDRQNGRIRLAFLTATLIFSMTEAGFRMLTPIWFAFLLSASECPLPLVEREVKRSRELCWLRISPAKQVRILR